MIKARVPAENPEALVGSYQQTREAFDWDGFEKERFDFRQTGQLNLAHEAVDRWAEDDRIVGRKALIVEKYDRVQSLTFDRLREDSCRWANLLAQCGFSSGDRLFIFLGPCLELYPAMLGCVRSGITFCPLYPSLGFDELRLRLENARPRGVLTHPDLVEHLPPETEALVEHILITGGKATGFFHQELAVEPELDRQPASFETRWVERETPLYLLYTSGSTGPPKGIVHGHGDLSGILATSRFVLDLEPGRVIWTDASPAWITGLVYGFFGPLLAGATAVVQTSPFQAATWYRTLERHQVNTWYTTPRTIRRLSEAGTDLPGRYDLTALKHLATVGTSLGPDLFYWALQNLGHTPHETWWMTETGMICLANFASLDTKPGAMGKPVPGVEAAVLDENGQPLPELTMGELALKIGWPALTQGLWQDRSRSASYYRHEGWFMTGDMAVVDEEGYFHHQGRNDDLIKVGDQLVGPYEIENVLLLHPGVNEAAVIALPAQPAEDSLPSAAQPLVKAFVRIGPGYQASARLKAEIRALVKANLSDETPLKDIEFITELPKTASGKLLRRVLRARELGLPAGDTSKLG